MDHLIVLSESSDIIVKRDWYGAHARLHERLGRRVSEDGSTTLWQFSMDPLTIDGDDRNPERFVRVRTNTPELHAAASSIASNAFEEAPVPAKGALVRFYATVSGKDSVVQRDVPAAERTKFEGRPWDMRDGPKVVAALERAGLLVNLNTLEVERARVLRIKRRPKDVFIPALRAKGEARVEDVDALIEGLTRGIGRDRSFGCGILVVEEIGEDR